MNEATAITHIVIFGGLGIGILVYFKIREQIFHKSLKKIYEQGFHEKDSKK